MSKLIQPIQLIQLVALAFALSACMTDAPPDPGQDLLDHATVYGSDRDKEATTITITITDKVPQLPDCANVPRTCKWEMQITMSRYHAYIFGTGTWESDWTYQLSVAFVPFDCDGKKQGYYRVDFPPTKTDPGDVLAAMLDLVKNRGGIDVTAALGGLGSDYDGDTCYLDREVAAQHFWMLFDYVVGLLEKSRQNVTAPVATGETIAVSSPREEGIARSVTQALYTIAHEPELPPAAGPTPGVVLAADWMQAAFAHYDGVPDVVEPIGTYPDAPAAAPMTAACVCAAAD